MKREREIDSITMANCLMLLSRGSDQYEATYSSSSSTNNRIFECKTCNRQFSSFQALGGHRASHKKPRLMEENNHMNGSSSSSSPPKPKTHECSICGLEFAIGQALGGHMRRHRAANLNENMQNNNNNNSTTLSCNSSGGGSSSLDSSSKVKVGGGDKRVFVLDLNLTPSENDLEIFKIGSKGTTGFVDYLY